jgi:hypothetical protein
MLFVQFFCDSLFFVMEFCFAKVGVANCNIFSKTENIVWFLHVHDLDSRTILDYQYLEMGFGAWE